MNNENTLYDFALVYTYANGSQFVEHYAKPQTLGQMVKKVEAAREKYKHEKNIVKIEYKTKEVDTTE